MSQRRGVARLRTPLLIGAAASLLAVVALMAGLLRPVELLAMDGMMRLRGPEPPDPRVVICDIDARSVDAYGQWPWPRTRIAELIAALDAAGARGIALDVVFSEPSRVDEKVDLSAEDETLARAIREAGDVVLGFFFRRSGGEAPGEKSRLSGGDPTNIRNAVVEQVLSEPPGGFAVPRRPVVEPNIDLLAAAAASQGFFSNERRSTGVLRHYDLLISHSDRYYPALALRAVAVFKGASLRLSAVRGNLPRIQWAGGPANPADRRLTFIATDERGGLWVNYRGPGRTYPMYSVVDVLEGRVGAEELAGRLVFIGASETGIGDLQATPFGSEMAGVEVHANVADNLLNASYIRDTGFQATLSMLALMVIGPMVGLLVGGGRRYLLGSLLAAVLVLAWPVLCYVAFIAAGWHLQVITPAAAGALALVAALRHQLVSVDRRAREIRGAFSRYVSSAVVEEILNDPEQLRLGGESREMTVFFSDIRGFTSLSEHMEPEGVVSLLNRFFTPMTRVVLAEGGTLDKYMGDALMAFFGAPAVQEDHAERACRAALAMRDELARLNRELSAASQLPAGTRLAVGIGLNSGDMAVGNMGSEQVFDYTVIGDAVNLGSRIEGLNKLYGTEILVSETTRQMAGDHFLFREIDRVRVKGKQTAVRLYELLASRAGTAEAVTVEAGTAETGPLEATLARLEQRAEAFERALAPYRDRDFATARQCFESLLDEHGEDGPARLYVERCRRFSLSPPSEDWDGVETLTSK